MTRRRCCCGCVILADSFDRPNSSDLGAEWNEISGDWQISGNRLIETGNSGATILSVQDAPDEPINFRVVVEDTFPDNGGRKYRIIVCAEDEDNYLFGQLETTTSNYTIWIGRRAAGVDSDPMDTWTSTEPFAYEQTVCLSYSGNTLAFVPAEQTGDGVWGCDSNPPGLKFGLANFGDEQVAYDDVDVQLHEASDPNCPACLCTCEYECLPKELTATFTATGNCYAMLNLATITLEREEGGTGYRTSFYGVDQPCDCAWCVLHNFELRLVCRDEGPDAWVLVKPGSSQCITAEWNELYGGDPSAPVNDNYACDPFFMEFGPFTVPPNPDLGSCDCCTPDDDTPPSGTYTITVTE